MDTIDVPYYEEIAETPVRVDSRYDAGLRAWIDFISEDGSVQVRLHNNACVWLKRSEIVSQFYDSELGTCVRVNKHYWLGVQERKQTKQKKWEREGKN